MSSLPRILFVLGWAVVSGCSSTEPIEPDVWQDPQTTVQTYDAAGRPTSGRRLADQVWGLGNDVDRAIDWDRVDEVLAESEIQPPDRSQPTTVADVSERPTVPGQSSDDQDPQTRDPQSATPQSGSVDRGGATAGPIQDPIAEQERLEREARLRNDFGAAIIFNADGTISKQYFLSSDSASVFRNLAGSLTTPPAADAVPAANSKYGGENLDSVLGRMLGPDHEIEVVYIQNFETYQNIRPRQNANNPAALGPATQNSLVLVTGKPEGVSKFERALDLFYANVPQVEIEVKVVEYQVGDSLSFGITPLDNATPTINNLRSGRLIQSLTSTFPINTPLTGTGSVLDQGLIALGGIHDSLELNAVLQALETQDVADIKSQPRLVVRNGGTATVSTTTAQPFPQARISNQTVTTTNIEFREIGIVMDIRPEIAGTESVLLNIYVSVSSVTGFAATDPVPTPIVSTREAATSVHLRHNESTVIGGLVTEQRFESETKFPILGDIPILGYLFRSTSEQSQKTVLEFHIRPTILLGRRGTSSETGF